MHCTSLTEWCFSAIFTVIYVTALTWSLCGKCCETGQSTCPCHCTVPNEPGSKVFSEAEKEVKHRCRGSGMMAWGVSLHHPTARHYVRWWLKTLAGSTYGTSIRWELGDKIQSDGKPVSHQIEGRGHNIWKFKKKNHLPINHPIAHKSSGGDPKLETEVRKIARGEHTVIMGDRLWLGKCTFKSCQGDNLSRYSKWRCLETLSQGADESRSSSWLILNGFQELLIDGIAAEQFGNRDHKSLTYRIQHEWRIA